MHHAKERQEGVRRPCLWVRRDLLESVQQAAVLFCNTEWAQRLWKETETVMHPPAM